MSFGGHFPGQGRKATGPRRASPDFQLKNIIVMLNPNIALEQRLSEQLYQSLHGNVIENILAQSSVDRGGAYWKNVMEGHSFKVEKRLMSHLHDLFQDVKEKLGFKEDVDFYVTGDSSVNAFAVASTQKDQPHIINVNSGLIDLMTDDELRFVIGHEFGHLINKDTSLLQLLYFVFPPGAAQPLMLQYKMRLWQQLSELVADRYGYMAIPDLEVCVSAFFKMSSGLDISRIDMEIDAYIEENLKHLEYFRTGQGLNTASHPVNPVRVQSLNLFATCKSDEELEEKMQDLVQMLLKIRNSELDMHTGVFLAAAGLLAASADEEVTEKEMQSIVESLAAYQMFPLDFLQGVSAQNVQEIFVKCVEAIMTINPGMRDSLFGYMVGLMLVDSSFNEKEMEFLFMIGENVFGYTKKEIADTMASAIQSNFVPSFETLC